MGEVEVRTLMLGVLFVISAGVIMLWTGEAVASLNNANEIEMCHASVRAAQLQKEITDISKPSYDCPKHLYTVYDNEIRMRSTKEDWFLSRWIDKVKGVFSDRADSGKQIVATDEYGREVGKKFPELKSAYVHNLAAKEIDECWYKLGGGNYDPFHQLFGKDAVNVLSGKSICFVCASFKINTEKYIPQDVTWLEYAVEHNITSLDYFQEYSKYLTEQKREDLVAQGDRWTPDWLDDKLGGLLTKGADLQADYALFFWKKSMESSLKKKIPIRDVRYMPDQTYLVVFWKYGDVAKLDNFGDSVMTAALIPHSERAQICDYEVSY
ncbi:hypothetical protein JW868_02845 [Candidatus Woesearchaeota archaeon]|nr:hypothetical protein [Candidatus Woesearchaeota archaeon]